MPNLICAAALCRVVDYLPRSRRCAYESQIGGSLASECFRLRPSPVTTGSQDIFTFSPASSFPESVDTA